MFNGLKPRKWTFWIKTIAGKVLILFFKKAENANRLFVPIFPVVYGLQFDLMLLSAIFDLWFSNLATSESDSRPR